MKVVVWDIESNGLLAEVTEVHCMAFYNPAKDAVITFDSERGNIDKGVSFLKSLLDKGFIIVGHNVSYDAAVMWKLHDFDMFKYYRQFFDTIHHSKMILPKFKLRNYKLSQKLPKGQEDSHSLGAWGIRLDCPKDDYTGGWEKFSQVMLKYNIQDVKTTYQVFKKLKAIRMPKKTSMNLEMYVAMIAAVQTIRGWEIDVEKVYALKGKLEAQREAIDDKLKRAFKPHFIAVKETDNKRNSSLWLPVDTDSARSLLESLVSPVAYTLKGKAKTKKLLTFKEENSKFFYKVNVAYVGKRTEIKLDSFKAGSRQSILKFMKLKYGYEPVEITDSKSPKLDADTFSKLRYTEAPLLTDRFKVSKKISEVNTLIKALSPNGTMHHNLDVLGADSTNRSSANNINVQQISSDQEFRELFIAPKGYKLVGTDLASVELFLLAIALNPFDGGRLIKILVEGDKSNGTDLHSINAKNMGVSRGHSKMVLYATLYSSGATLIGYNTWEGEGGEDITIEEFDQVKASLMRRGYNHNGTRYFRVKKGLHVPITDELVYMTIFGKEIKEKLIGGMTGMKELINSIEKESKDNGKFIKSLDGRLLAEQSKHSLLNYKLQGNGAVFAKDWVRLIYANLSLGLTMGKEYEPRAFVHDEVQLVVKDDKKVLDRVTEIIHKAVETISAKYKLPIYIEADVDVGDSWHDTH